MLWLAFLLSSSTGSCGTQTNLVPRQLLYHGLLWSFYLCTQTQEPCVVLKSSCLQLTVEKAQLQKRCQSCQDHEEQESSSPPQKPNHWAHGQAGCQGDPRHGIVVRIEVVGDRHLRLVPHHAFCKTVVYAVTSQPRERGKGKRKLLKRLTHTAT